MGQVLLWESDYQSGMYSGLCVPFSQLFTITLSLQQLQFFKFLSIFSSKVSQAILGRWCAISWFCAYEKVPVYIQSLSMAKYV